MGAPLLAPLPAAPHGGNDVLADEGGIAPFGIDMFWSSDLCSSRCERLSFCSFVPVRSRGPTDAAADRAPIG